MAFPVAVQPISLGPWGGSGGNGWSYIANNRISEIILNIAKSNTNIISFSLKESGDLVSGTFGGRDPSDQGTVEKITIQSSEYLIAIEGTFGKIGGVVAILSLSFVTDHKTYGPFGDAKSGEAFSIPVANCVVVGFFGRCGYFLDAIGVYLRPTVPGETISIGPWGGKGGSKFEFKVDGYLNQITVNYDRNNVKSFSLKDAKGHKYGPFGGQNPKDVGEKTIIDIGELERMTSIAGTYGAYGSLLVITSLKFIINDTPYGPYGSETGTSFSIPIKGVEIVGFSGRAGHYIDAVGVYVKPMELLKHLA